MRTNIIITTLAAVVMLCGCQSVSTIKPERAAAGSSVRRDEFKKMTEVRSMLIHLTNIKDPDCYQFVAARTDKMTNTVYFIALRSQPYVGISEVWDETGRRLERSRYASLLEPGSVHFEEFLAPISREDLEAMKERPVRFRAYYGGLKSTIFETDLPVAKGFLQKCDATFPTP